MKKIKFRKGQIINNREIISCVTLGKKNIYKTICRICETVVMMNEDSLKQKRSCRICYRRKLAKEEWNGN